MANSLNVSSRLELKKAGWQTTWRLFQLTRKISGKAHPQPGVPRVAFFNASTRLTGLSLNAAFAYLTACGLQLAGAPVAYFGCHAGMSRCVLGTDRDNHKKSPPCSSCINQAEGLFSHSPTQWFEYYPNKDLSYALHNMNVEELSTFEWPLGFPQGSQNNLPLGLLTVPSLRWALRRHRLPDDEATRFLLCAYQLSAFNVANQFAQFLYQFEPETVVIFNGIMFPEATAKWVAQKVGVRVVTHEVGFRPYSAFFTDGEATAYPIDIPDDFVLNQDQISKLDTYLDHRFQGEFTMAGIRFWPEMVSLGENFSQKASQFQQVVPVFTNVVYDTSQLHANTVFPHMFAWLDLVLELIRGHPETLFVIRAHPDEMRPGTGKQSRETVEDWIARNQVESLENVVFIQPQKYISSYELVKLAKFVMVYNSSIGLEATLMGTPVLCGGNARYTQYPIVYFPDTPEGYRDTAEDFLINLRVELPSVFRRNARRFLYYQLFRASLPFDEFLTEHPRPGFVQLKKFPWQSLSTERSTTMKVLVDGILSGKPFLLENNQ